MFFVKIAIFLCYLYCSIHSCVGEDDVVFSWEKMQDSHIGLLDIRVGRVVEVIKPYNDSNRCVGRVDFGVFPLNIFVVDRLYDRGLTMDDIKYKSTIFVANVQQYHLEDRYWREAVMLAADDGERAELLRIPWNGRHDDQIICKGYPNAPLQAAKEEFINEILADCKIIDNGTVMYKKDPWNVNHKGYVYAPTMDNVPIKML